jgi:hypothetical protein
MTPEECFEKFWDEIYPVLLCSLGHYPDFVENLHFFRAAFCSAFLKAYKSL